MLSFSVLRILTLLALLFFLSSCIDGEEEITVNPDASGTFVARYEFPSAVAARMGPPARYRRELQRIDEEEDAIEITHMEIGFVRGKLIFHLDVTFHDVTELLEVAERQQEKFVTATGVEASEFDTLLGGIDFALDGTQIDFTRAMALGPMLPTTVRINPRFLMDSQFRFKINLPIGVESSNAHEISADGKSMAWSFMLRDYIDQPIQMEFRTKPLVPWWAWIVLPLTLIAILFLIWKVVRRVLK